MQNRLNQVSDPVFKRGLPYPKGKNMNFQAIKEQATHIQTVDCFVLGDDSEALLTVLAKQGDDKAFFQVEQVVQVRMDEQGQPCELIGYGEGYSKDFSDENWYYNRFVIDGIDDIAPTSPINRLGINTADYQAHPDHKKIIPLISEQISLIRMFVKDSIENKNLLDNKLTMLFIPF